VAWLIILWWAIGLAVEGIGGILTSRAAALDPPFSVDELRSPREGCLLGIYVSGVPGDMRLLEEAEERVRRGFPLISVYQAWGSRPEQQFDPRPLNRILARGAIPVLTWEPWVTDFSNFGLRPMPDRQIQNLRAIAKGDYDFYIEGWARAAKRWGHPLMVRLAHEMNASWYPWGEHAFRNTAADYVDMWRHVVGIFRRVDADNVIWVWSLALRPFTEDLYPGSEYVDWVSITVLNFGTTPPGWQWRSFKELFSTHYAELRKLGKPIMIAEVASAEEGGDKARWISEAMSSLSSDFPLVRAFIWFNVAQDLYWPINWSLTSSQKATRAFRRAAADPHFIARPR